MNIFKLGEVVRCKEAFVNFDEGTEFIISKPNYIDHIGEYDYVKLTTLSGVEIEGSWHGSRFERV